MLKTKTCEFYNPRVQKDCLWKDIKATKDEARSREIENLKNCIIVHQKKESESVRNIATWVKGIRTFKKNTKKKGQKQMQKLVRVNQTVKNSKFKESRKWLNQHN